MSPGKHDRRPVGIRSGVVSAGHRGGDLASEYASAGLDEAIEVAERDWFSIGAKTAIVQLAKAGRAFTSYDVRVLVGDPWEPHLMGAVFAAAARSRVIESCGATLDRDDVPRRLWRGVA